MNTIVSENIVNEIIIIIIIDKNFNDKIDEIHSVENCAQRNAIES